jgi:hypothetical protein
LPANPFIASTLTKAWISHLIEQLIFNSVLHIPKGVLLAPFFGTTPYGQINGQPYILDIAGETPNAGVVKVSIEAPEGILQLDFLISSAQLTQNIQNIPKNPDDRKDTLSFITKGRLGLTLGVHRVLCIKWMYTGVPSK